MNYSKSAVLYCKIVEKVQFVCGIFFAVLFGLVIVISMLDDVEDEISSGILYILFTLLGAFLIVLSRKRKKLVRDVKEYSFRLSSDPFGSIDKLAASLRVTPEAVRSNLDLMIKRRFFTNVYIDRVENRIVFHNQVSSNPLSQIVAGSKPQPVEYQSMTCKNCGGFNKGIKGKVIECEYCGSPLDS